MTLTILAWLAAFVIYVVVFGWPQGADAQEAASFMLALPACVIGGGIYYDIFGHFPPRGDGAMIFYFLISGISAVGVFSVVGLAMILAAPAQYYGNAAIRGIVAVIGFVSSVLGIIGFYLDHVK